MLRSVRWSQLKFASYNALRGHLKDRERGYMERMIKEGKEAKTNEKPPYG